MSRVVLLLPVTSYKAEDFLAAAASLGVEVVAGTDRRQALEGGAPDHSLAVDYRQPDRAVGAILRLAARQPLDAIVGTDDETCLVAALAARELGLRHNDPEAVRRTRDKLLFRRALAAAGLRGPRFESLPVVVDPRRAAERADYPCVLKPLCLSASRGVIRADGPAEFVAAFERIGALLDDPELRREGGDCEHLIVESYMPGHEIAVEALLDDGQLRVLAVFDKPDPMEGPYFEETIFVTPSRHDPELRRAAIDEVARGCEAIGLREGPVHAELRLHDGAPWLIEIAARTIGGLCARTLRFGAGVSLETLVLRHALGMGIDGIERESGAAGVMMLPVPRGGVLRAVEGLESARGLPGVREVTLTRHIGGQVVPLPEGHRYLGFIFAVGDEPAEVESILRRAHDRLHLVIDQD